jgi:excisionase family DNA binding protein
VHEVAELLKVPVSWVYERTRRRGSERLPHLKIGKYLRFRREDVLGWLDACKI